MLLIAEFAFHKAFARRQPILAGLELVWGFNVQNPNLESLNKFLPGALPFRNR